MLDGKGRGNCGLHHVTTACVLQRLGQLLIQVLSSVLNCTDYRLLLHRTSGIDQSYVQYKVKSVRERIESQQSQNAFLCRHYVLQ